MRIVPVASHVVRWLRRVMFDRAKLRLGGTDVADARLLADAERAAGCEPEGCTWLDTRTNRDLGSVAHVPRVRSHGEPDRRSTAVALAHRTCRRPQRPAWARAQAGAPRRSRAAGSHQHRALGDGGSRCAVSAASIVGTATSATAVGRARRDRIDAGRVHRARMVVAASLALRARRRYCGYAAR